jgi:hypothetical protein
MSSNLNWSYLKILIVIISALSGFFASQPENSDFLAPAPWYFPLTIILFMATGLPFIVTMMRKAENLQRPTWNSSPLSFDQPLIIFDLSAYCTIAYGAMMALVNLQNTPYNWSWEIPLSAGIGIWIGVRLSVQLYYKSR